MVCATGLPGFSCDGQSLGLGPVLATLALGWPKGLARMGIHRFGKQYSGSFNPGARDDASGNGQLFASVGNLQTLASTLAAVILFRLDAYDSRSGRKNGTLAA